MTGPCGTPYIVDSAVRFPRPTNQTVFDTTHFRIHYDTTGSWAVTLAYARKVAEAAETSWEIEVDYMGFEEPPPDNGAGGDDRYDIHIADLTGGVLGYTQPEGAGPDPNQEDYISHVVVDKDLSDNDKKTTVSHEFMHACQFSYSGVDGTWFMENCAVWAEEMVYPSINQYVGYLGGIGPLKTPYYEITNGTSLYWYAGVVWALFLMFWQEDTSIIEQCWDLMGVHWGNHTLQDIDSILRTQYSDSLEDALANYAEWRWFVSGRWDDWHWSESSMWPVITTLKTHHSYPAAGNEATYDIHGPGGADYVVFDSYSGHDSLYFYFDGDDGWLWGVRIIGYRSGHSNPSDIYQMSVDADGYGALAVPTSDYDSLILVPYCVNWFNTTPALPFIYWVDVVGLDESTASLDLNITARGRDFTFILPAAGSVDLRVYDASGRRAFGQELDMESGENTFRLPQLSTGVYFWEARYAGTRTSGKTAIY